MQIAPIGMNYTNSYNIRKGNTRQVPNFTQRVQLSDPLAKDVFNRVLYMLSGCTTEVIENANIKLLNKVMDELVEKYSYLSTKSAGIMLIGPDDMKTFFKNTRDMNLNDKIGLCVAVGDKYGPVEKCRKYMKQNFLSSTKRFLNLKF